MNRGGKVVVDSDGFDVNICDDRMVMKTDCG